MLRTVDLLWRPLCPYDLPVWAGLLRSVEGADNVGEHYSLEDLSTELSEPGLDLSTDTLAAFHDDQLVAYGLVRRRDAAQGHPTIDFEGAVLPGYRGRGIGGSLMNWVTRRTHKLPDPVELRSRVSDRTPGYATLLKRHKFTESGWIVELERALLIPSPPVELPAQMDVLPMTKLPEELMYRAYLDAFGGSLVDWQRLISGASFRPDLSFGVLDRARVEVVALLTACYFDADTAASGSRNVYVQGLAARRSSRGMGLSGAMINLAAEHYRAAGFEKLTTSVTIDHPSTELSAFASWGLTPIQRWTIYAR